MDGRNNLSIDNSYKPGDRVVYQMSKRSTHPGPRARDIFPAPRGESYSYVVEKYWVVEDVIDSGRVVLKTRKGKTHIVPVNDFRLRPANWWEKFFHNARFPQLENLDVSAHSA